MKTLRLALAQINLTVGDLAGNSRKILGYIRKAKRHAADIVLVPELAVTGYPPEDLLLKPQFVSDNLAALKDLVSGVSGIAAIIGFVDRGRDNLLYNAAALVAEGKVIDIYHKVLLPNYGVFDEIRYFSPGKGFPVYRLNGIPFGINICEDIWHRHGPARMQAAMGARLILNINASPYETGKPLAREKILSERSSELGVTIAYLNTVGGQDELVFDGQSMVFDSSGRLLAKGKQFEEDLIVVECIFENGKRPRRREEEITPDEAALARKVKVPSEVHETRILLRSAKIVKRMGREEEIYRALVLGTADYAGKNGFNGAVIGLSGGIDSSLVAAVASDALGRDKVTGIFMPSPYTSQESREDAFGLAENLGLRILEVPIQGIMLGYMDVLSEHFREKEKDTTEENLQARIRGNLLMAFSNKFGWLVLTTGNKSEMSVGYATLYGDMAGGFAVIKDIPKTLVYDLCKWRNAQGTKPVIPDRVMWKEPTAELKPDQRDSDTLPPYEVLDPVLKAYVEDEMSFANILNPLCDRECVTRVIAMVDRSEYKRRQSPPGIKITGRAFGRDRRFPITNRYRSY